MRTALLAAIKRTETQDLRAELKLGGRSVLGWQIELARKLRCERFICLCEAKGDFILSLQREIESRGGEFHAIRSNLQLAALVRADDELLMLLDGLVVDLGLAPDLAIELIPGGTLSKSIATLPAGHGAGEAHPHDFERIDATRCWAGFAVMRANQVHKLASLPPDGDAMSLLLRLGLQAEVQCVELGPEGVDPDHWLLATSAEILAEREGRLIRASSAEPVWSGPGRALAASLVRRLPPSGLARGLDRGPEFSALAAAALLLGGVGLAAFGYASAGLVVAAIGAFAGNMAGYWGNLRARLLGESQINRFADFLDMGADLAAIVILLAAFHQFSATIVPLAVPILAIGIAQVGARLGREGAAAFWQDRVLHLSVFAGASVFGFLGEAVSLFGGVALLQLMRASRARAANSGLTIGRV